MRVGVCMRTPRLIALALAARCAAQDFAVGSAAHRGNGYCPLKSAPNTKSQKEWCFEPVVDSMPATPVPVDV